MAVSDDIVRSLSRKFGKPQQVGRAQVFIFGNQIACSVSYSKLLGGHKYFFAVPAAMRDSTATIPETKLGEYVLLICGSADNVLVLRRSFVIEMLSYVPNGRVDVIVENGSFIFQTTKKPKIDVTEFLNAFPSPTSEAEPSASEDEPKPDRLHVRVQWGLIRLGLLEGCSVWVPTNDRCLSHKGVSFAAHTLGRLPNFGFDAKTSRVIENIDVLWLARNVIRKAFEIESTTSVYSGLLRLNDLVLSQPNNRIELFITAGESRRAKVHDELVRPTFRELIKQCQFASFETILAQLDRLSDLGLDEGQRVTGLIKGESFYLPDHYQ